MLGNMSNLLVNTTMRNSHNKITAMAWMMFTATLFLAACGPPASMQVRKGGEPDQEDEEVLFQTTYYFRVFDFCEDKEGETSGQKHQIGMDNLYRFKMTGKGFPWMNQVRFESGTLKAWQIDPFGASIEVDKQTGNPYYVSSLKQNEIIEQQKSENEIYNTINELEKLRQNYANGEENKSKREKIDTKIANYLELIGLKKSVNNISDAKTSAANALENLGTKLVPTNDSNKDKLIEIQKSLNNFKINLTNASDRLSLHVEITNALELLSNMKNTEIQKFNIRNNSESIIANDEEKKKYINNTIDILNKSKEIATTTLTDDAIKTKQQLSAHDLVCENGLPAKRGFQVFGPEGWRTFDQDERLVLAMSNSGKPLLDSLRDVSSRIMEQKSAKGISREELLAQVLAATRARAKLLELDSQGQNFEEGVNAVKKSFDAKE